MSAILVPFDDDMKVEKEQDLAAIYEELVDEDLKLARMGLSDYELGLREADLAFGNQIPMAGM